MIRLPDDNFDNVGWAVKARTFHRCEVRDDGCTGIRAGEFYYRAMAWPGSDVNPGRVPWIMRICRTCLRDQRRAQFDAALPHVHRPGHPCPVGGYVRPRQFWMAAGDKSLTHAEENALCTHSSELEPGP